jgi:NADH-quinone oxidoreductase subunit F
MDLVQIAAPSTAEEREAVDAILGVPETGWEGGDRRDLDGHVAHGGREAQSRRDQLLPVLHAVQARVGWISQGALGYVCRRLSIPPAEAYGVASFYALFSLSPRSRQVAHVCDDIACLTAGAHELCEELERTLGPPGEPSADGRSTWMRSPCLGLCDLAPAALIVSAGEEPSEWAVGPATPPGVAGARGL